MNQKIRDGIDILRDSGIRIKVGLRQQGHMDTVTRMLEAGLSWDEIGLVIGWSGRAVKEWYAIEKE